MVAGACGRLWLPLAIGALLGASGGALPAIEIVNNQPFRVAMPLRIRGVVLGSGYWLTSGGHPAQQDGSEVVLLAELPPSSSTRVLLRRNAAAPARPPLLVVRPETEGIAVAYAGQDLGRLAWDIYQAPPSSTPPAVASTFAPLPLVFRQDVKGPLFARWTAEARKGPFRLTMELDAYPTGYLDVRARFLNESPQSEERRGEETAEKTYAAVVCRWVQPAAAARTVSYDNRVRSFGWQDATPFRAGEGRHWYVQRGVDWLATRFDAGTTALWLNDFAESFTVYESSSDNRFRQPRYLGANVPQLGSEMETEGAALYAVTEIARPNIASYRDRLVDGVLSPPDVPVTFASRLVFAGAALTNARANEIFVGFAGHTRQTTEGRSVRVSLGVPSVRFGTSYFPYSTLGENFDRLKLPGMDSEGYWPLAADTVVKWPLFADAIRRDLRIAKAVGFHVIRLHYLDVIARLPAAVQRGYLDFLFEELRHLRLGALLSPSEARWTPAEIAAMVARYRDVVEGVELENEILIWGIPQDRPRYWTQVYEAVKAVAPGVPVHLTAHTNTGIFTRLAQLGVPFDRIGAHGYIDSLDAIPSGRGLALAVGNYAAKTGKPAVITEWNWRGLTRMTPEARARVYPDIIGGALETRAIGEFHQFQFQETLTVNPRLGRSGIRHYEPLRLSRRPKPEAFALIDVMRRFVADDDPIRRFDARHSTMLLDRGGRAIATVAVTNRSARTERMRAIVETSPDLRATLAGSAEAALEPGETATFEVRLASRGRVPGFYHWFLRLETDDGTLRYLWNAARLAGRPAFDARTRSSVSYPGGAASTIALDFSKPISVVYGQNAPVLEMEAAHVLAGTLESASGAEVEIDQLADLPQGRASGTLILVGTPASHALIAQAAGGRTLPRGSFVQRIAAPHRPDETWILAAGADSRAVEEAALDYVLRYWRRAKDSAARRIGLVEKTLPRTVDPAKLPDRTP